MLFDIICVITEYGISQSLIDWLMDRLIDWSDHSFSASHLFKFKLLFVNLLKIAAWEADTVRCVVCCLPFRPMKHHTGAFRGKSVFVDIVCGPLCKYWQITSTTAAWFAHARTYAATSAAVHDPHTHSTRRSRGVSPRQKTRKQAFLSLDYAGKRRRKITSYSMGISNCDETSSGWQFHVSPFFRPLNSGHLSSTLIRCTFSEFEVIWTEWVTRDSVRRC